MKKYTSLGLLALLLTVALALASCGGSSSAQQGQSESGDEEQASQESTGEDTHGMEHGEMSGMEMGSDETAPKDLIVDRSRPASSSTLHAATSLKPSTFWPSPLAYGKASYWPSNGKKWSWRMLSCASGVPLPAQGARSL